MKSIIQITAILLLLTGCSNSKMIGSKNATTSPGGLKDLVVTYGKPLHGTKIKTTAAPGSYMITYKIDSVPYRSNTTGTILNATKTIPDPYFLDYKKERKFYREQILWIVIVASLFIIAILSTYLTSTKNSENENDN